jgi:hypothetical protein
MELTNTGSLIDPEVTNLDRICNKEKVLYLDPAEELFMLALRAEKPARPNIDYVKQVYTFIMVLPFRIPLSLNGSKQDLITKGPSESRILCLWTSFDRKTSLGTLSTS